MSLPQVTVQSERRSGDNLTELRNYRLIERQSQEELATVYRASHLTLDRPVQVHLLRRHDWISASRFQLAARLAAHLSHPNLVPVIDAGHDEKYGDYLVTPELDARPLSVLLREGALPPALTVRVVAQIALALDYLHSQQIFHRDVQPANVFVTSGGVAYLANLSLAAGPDTPDLSSIDEADYLTPYSAPEQRLAQGEAGAALDVYSLGALTFHMLSGELPPAPGLELPSLATRDAGLAPADRIVRRMLASDPAARFPSAGIAAAALRQALRSLVDLSTADMEESRWETGAEWLENPVETALGPTLDEGLRDFIARARRRADDLHRRDVIRRTLNRWSRDGFFRRRPLGQLISPEQIVSYNLYFYELRTLYESRSGMQVHTRPAQTGELSANLPPLDLWKVAVNEPEDGPFVEVRPQTLPVPNSSRLVGCNECASSGGIRCRTCKGSGTVEKTRKVSDRDRSSASETFSETCTTCKGVGREPCPRCNGSGNLIEEQVFTWARQARRFNNTDDIEGLPEGLIRRRLEPVFTGMINAYEGRWHSVAPLAELLRAAITAAEADEDTRIIATELTIQGAPITEMDFTLDEKPQRLYLIGFDNELVGDWSLLNSERVILAIIVVLLSLLAALALLLTFV